MDKRLTRLSFVCLTTVLLLAQLVLVAGHVHLGGRFGAAAHLSADAAGQYDEHTPGTPGQQRHRCPLCLAQSAAGTPILPAGADFEQPRLRAIEQVRHGPQTPRTLASHRIFQPRAPPVSA